MRSEVLGLAGPYVFLALTTALLCLYIMQQTWHDKASQGDPLWLQWTRRFGYVLVALMLGWSSYYATTSGWQPVPPVFGLVVALALVFFVRAIILSHAANGKRHYPQSPVPAPKSRPF